MTEPGPEAAGRRFRTYFTAVCIDIRQGAGASLGKVSDLVGIDSNSIRRFEKGETFPHKNLEHYAAAYSALTDPPADPRDVFLRAAEWWQQTGRAPLLATADGHLADEPTPAQIVADIRRAANIAQERAQAAEPPNATRKRRKGAG